MGFNNNETNNTKSITRRKVMKKAILGMLSLLTGAAGGAISVGKISGEKIKGWHQLSDKHLNLFLMMNQWVKVKQEEKIYLPILKKRNIRRLQFMV